MTSDDVHESANVHVAGLDYLGENEALFVISEGRLHDETELLSRAGEEKRANNIRKMAQADV